MTLLIYVLMLGFGVCFLLSLWRWKTGPNAVDRILLFDLATSLSCGLLVLASILFKQSTFLDIALLLSVIAFVSTIGFAYWIEKGKDL